MGQAGGLALECHGSDRGIGSGMSLVPIQKLVKNLKSHIDISIVVFPPVPVVSRAEQQFSVPNDRMTPADTSEPDYRMTPEDSRRILRNLTIMTTGNMRPYWPIRWPIRWLIIRANVRLSGFRLDSCCRLYQ